MAQPERTEDGHHVVVDGRRWRATDPAVPEDLRQELVDELMAARREVGAGTGDGERVAAARSRVQDAKVALGERGHPWWEEPDAEQLRERLAAVHRALARSRDRDGDGADDPVGADDLVRALGRGDDEGARAAAHDVAGGCA